MENKLGYHILQQFQNNIYNSEISQYIVKKLCPKKLCSGLRITFFFLQIFGLIFTVTKKFISAYREYQVDTVVKTVDTTAHFLITVANIIGFAVLLRRTILLNLIIRFNGYNNKKEHNSVVFQVAVIILYSLSALPFIITVCSSIFLFGWQQYQYLISQDLDSNIFNVLTILVVGFANKIKNEFLELNNSLLHISQDNIFVCKIKNTGSLEKPLYLERLKYFNKTHNELCDLLNEFNKSFKNVLFCIIICIYSSILWNVTIFLKISLIPLELFPIAIRSYLLCSRTLNILIATGQAALAAMVGEHIAEEGHKTSVLCYSLLNKIPKHRQTETDQLIEKQLYLLLDQSKTRNISLHAGGFFKLDWGILGSIASTVATYSIVIIQFLLK